MDLAYQVNQIKVVLPEDIEDLLIQGEKDYVTLLTCTPFGINDHRLLVRGERIDYDFTKKQDTYTLVKPDMYFWVMVVSIFLLILFILILMRMHKNRKGKDRR